eukprot:g44358.t1
MQNRIGWRHRAASIYCNRLAILHKETYAKSYWLGASSGKYLRSQSVTDNFTRGNSYKIFLVPTRPTRR